MIAKDGVAHEVTWNPWSSNENRTNDLFAKIDMKAFVKYDLVLLKALVVRCVWKVFVWHFLIGTHSFGALAGSCKHLMYKKTSRDVSSQREIKSLPEGDAKVPKNRSAKKRAAPSKRLDKQKLRGLALVEHHHERSLRGLIMGVLFWTIRLSFEGSPTLFV